MMNMLIGFKSPTKKFGHYKAMLIDFASAISHHAEMMISPYPKFDIAMIRPFAVFRTSPSHFLPRERLGTIKTTTRETGFASLPNQIIKLCPALITTLSTGDLNKSATAPWLSGSKAKSIPMDNGAEFNRLVASIFLLGFGKQTVGTGLKNFVCNFLGARLSFWPGHRNIIPYIRRIVKSVQI